MDFGDIQGWLVPVLAILYYVVWPILKALRERNQTAEHEPLRDPDLVQQDAVPVQEVLAAQVALAEQRDQWVARLNALQEQSISLSRRARTQRATYPFAEVLDDFLLPRVQEITHELEQAEPQYAPQVLPVLRYFELVYKQLYAFVEEREDPQMKLVVGDADALARSCYRPMMDFARAHELSLTSGVPVCQLGYPGISVWTGFIPTGLAPIFLTGDFFSNVFWWPAIAHEIGHDFLAATGEVEASLRAQLGLSNEETGLALLQPQAGALTLAELRRVFGGWFEEVFCDIFGTLMLGPAYGYAMVRLFARPDRPELTRQVQLADAGRSYDAHPPRHLRVLITVETLRHLGERPEADEIQEHWEAQHGPLQNLIFPAVGRQLVIPAEPVAGIASEITHRLYHEQLQGLAGHRLSRLPGVDYGPHEAAEARRVSECFLRGEVPIALDARSVIAGAVLAVWREPERHATVCQLARTAIPAIGTGEHRPDVYEELPRFEADRTQQEDSIAAFTLHTILAPARSARWARSGGLLRRPQNSC